MAGEVLLLSQAQLAKRWGKDPGTIRRWTKAELLPTFVDPDSKRIMYPLASIEKFEGSFTAPKQVAS